MRTYYEVFRNYEIALLNTAAIKSQIPTIMEKNNHLKNNKEKKSHNPATV